MSTIREVFNSVYGFNESEIDDLWVEWGSFSNLGKFDRQGYGRLGGLKVAVPDDRAVYMSAGRMKPGTSRANENVERVTVLTIDDVGSSIDRDAMEMLAPEPTVIIETSPGNHQWQYAIAGGMEPARYVALRAAMKANGVWGSSHATAPSNLVRLPWGVNGKPGAAGHKVVRVGGSGRAYAADELERLFGGTLIGVNNVRVPVAGALKAPSDAMVEDLIKLLPNDGVSPYCDTYQAWINFGMALYGATEGRGLELWLAWCRGQAQGVDPEQKWSSFAPTSSGWETLLMYADKWALDRGALAGALFDDGVDVNRHEDVINGDNEEVILDADIEALQRDVANLIVRTYGGGIRFNVSTGFWHAFDQTWKETPHALGYRLAKKWADRNAGMLGKKARAEVSKSAFYSGVEKILQADEHLAVVKTDFDCDDWLLGTPGGTVDLRTGALVPAKASDMIALSTNVVPAGHEDCPRWLAFVDWACTDPATGLVDGGMVRMLKQWSGYNLTGDVSKEAVMFLHGGGANGKGTYIETMNAVMGSYFYMADKDLFMAGQHKTHTEEIAALAGKRMVAADEVPTSSRWNESLLKGVSGGGVMTTRHLYGRMFSFPIRFKVTISGNEKPAFQGAINEALKRRLHLAEFRMTARPIDDTLKKTLAAEAPGVLRWMLNGLADMLSSPGGRLFVADSTISATDSYFNDNDLFKRWLDECTTPSPGGSAAAADAFQSWSTFKSLEGGSGVAEHQRAFKDEMTRRGYIWKKTMTTNVFKGLVLKKGVDVF